MSQWTHVTALIRYDAVLAMMGEPITKEELGEISTFENPIDDTIIPCGSEGSLEYEILKTGGDSSLACRAVAFWGDLRDFGKNEIEDVKSILDYLDKITKDKMIRSGVVEITVEFRHKHLYHYNTKTLEWVRAFTKII